jgi:hydroxymethylbilane synthase
MKNKKIIIGSRGSKLALIYAERAKSEIMKFAQISGIEEVEIKSITTTGDTIQNTRLSDYGGKGLFSKTIEDELLSEKIDIAVHALKDIPSDETKGLITNCFLERNDPREILISKDNKHIKDLVSNSIVGTSSFRREFQLKKIRGDLNYKLIRGNVDTRIKKLNDNLYDAIILSYAGIQSLNLDKNISQIFSTSEIIPSVGQGVVALQCKENDQELIKLLNKVNHQPTHNCIKAERNVLKILEGDCETAVGAFAKIEKDNISLEAELFSLDGKERFYYKASKELKLASELGKEAGTILKKDSKNSYKK